MKTYWRILKFGSSETWMLPFYLLFVLLHTVFRVVNFVALVPLFRILFGLDEQILIQSKPVFTFSTSFFVDSFHYYMGQLMIGGDRLGALYFVCGILVASVFLSNLFLYLVNLIQARVRINSITHLRQTLFDKIVKLDIAYIMDQKKGDTVARVTSDIQQIEITVVNTLKVLIKEPILIIGYFVTMFSISSELTAYTVMLVPISGLLIGFLTRRLRQQARIAQNAVGNISSLMNEALQSLKMIRLFDAEAYFKRSFDTENKLYAQENRRMAAVGNLAGPLSEFLGVGFVALLLVIGGKLILGHNATLDAANFLLFLIMFSQILNPAKAISNAFSGIQKGIASGERVFEILDQKMLIIEAANPRSISQFEKSIRFVNVEFHYGNNRVLHDINFELNKGQTIALVGPSGSGKSTIASLIARFYDPTAGQILLDDHPLDRYKIADIHRNITMVTQEPILLHDSIYQNILIGNPSASKEEVVEAARKAHADPFINQLPAGYDTVIGDMGIKLSGGERQRLTIARAILNNPTILILDEATSSLDSEAEQEVQLAIKQLMQGRTTLVIAHRMSTIEHADQVLVIEGGRIIENGTPDALKRRGSYYQRMLEMQQI